MPALKRMGDTFHIPGVSAPYGVYECEYCTCVFVFSNHVDGDPNFCPLCGEPDLPSVPLAAVAASKTPTQRAGRRPRK